MRKNFFLIVFILSSQLYLKAQPYLDLLNVQNTVGSNINFLKNDNTLVHFNASLNMPLKLNKEGSKLLLLNPFFEKWEVNTISNTNNIFKSAASRFQLNSFGMPIGYLTKLNTKWKLLTVFIPRTSLGKDNMDITIPSLKFNQFGGYALSTYEYKKSVKFKFGLYFNKEYGRKLILPLAGIDWKINDKNLLFGVLPDKMIYEHKVNKVFYYGAIFESLSSSYKSYDTNHFVRVDDNRLGAYTDLYALKHFVIRLEAGHTILRKIKTDMMEIPIQDGFYCKIQANFRIRF
jgi:hypothetical protein